ncbi:MAG: ankyrin repeat domain-containing protein, partial [Bryobacterales bacterium]|nr:ankyrin repeat domain-containing protein [Bryobacterales bacterium]
MKTRSTYGSDAVRYFHLDLVGEQDLGMLRRNSVIFSLGVLTIAAMALYASDSELFQAIRDGNTARLTALLNSGANANPRDQFGATPLMYAAAYGSIKDMEALLKAGANANAATSQGSTALMWATADPSKIQLLLRSAASVNARTKDGATALLSAAVRGNDEALRQLIAAGADIRANMLLIPGFPIRATIQTIAYSTNEPALRNFLREIGPEAPDPKPPSFTPPSTLMSNFFSMNVFSMRPSTKPGLSDGIRSLLDMGADPNSDVRQLARLLTPLGAAAMYGDSESVRLLLKRGADPNRPGTSEITPLMVAASAEEQNPEIVQLLLDHGADIAAQDKARRTALDWASMLGESEAKEILAKRGARPGNWKPVAAPAAIAQPRNISEAVRVAIERLQHAGPTFHKSAGCISCHHQSLPAIAVQVAAMHGVHVDTALRPHPTEATLQMWSPSRENFFMGNCSIFGFLGNVSYGLWSMSEEGVSPNPITDAAAACLSSLQWPDGRWEGGDMRPPLAGRTPIVYTALAIRALKTYSPGARHHDVEARIGRARAFLQSATPPDTQGEAFRLLGLIWSGAPGSLVRSQRERILR